MLKVLIVDDSAVICTMIRRVMETDTRFSVAGLAHDGQAAVEKNTALKPDLIIMDIHMPVMDGIEATREILKTSKPAIVAFTTEDKAEVGYKCLEAGALEIIKKPNLTDMTPKYMKDFCDRLAAISDTHKLITMRSNDKTPATQITSNKPVEGQYEVLLIGASTGGPTAIQTVLKGLGNSFPVPILVTQHIDKDFDEHFVKWMKDTTNMNIELAKSGTIIEKGMAYVAPADKHLKVKSKGIDSYALELSDDPPVHFLRPAVDVMFESAAETYKNKAFAVLLTGMGKDGADGCAAIVEKGGFTVAEDESTCVVFGMPKAAIDKNAASTVVPLDKIADYIKSIFK